MFARAGLKLSCKTVSSRGKGTRKDDEEEKEEKKEYEEEDDDDEEKTGRLSMCMYV